MGGPTVFFDTFSQKMFGEEWNILTALPEGGQIQRNDVDAVVEVFAELPLANEVFEVLVRRCDDTHIHLDGLYATDSGELSFLQDAQQLGLRHGAEVADLVEEERAGIGEFELPDSTGRGIRKRAFFMAEQLTFDERFRKGCAVQRNEGALTPAAIIVERLGDQFLARTALAAD